MAIKPTEHLDAFLGKMVSYSNGRSNVKIVNLALTKLELGFRSRNRRNHKKAKQDAEKSKQDLLFRPLCRSDERDLNEIATSEAFVVNFGSHQMGTKKVLFRRFLTFKLLCFFCKKITAIFKLAVFR